MSLKVLFVLAIISLTIGAQNPNMPEGRASAIFIYHPPSKALFLFDGYQIHPDSGNSVWKWDGKIWEKIVATGPESRSLSAGAYNKDTGLIQLFGGVGKGGYEKSKKGDSWSFDGARWQKVTTNNIGTRDHHKMVYADHLNAFVLYGGNDEKRASDTTTWILKDNKFTPLKIPGPGARYHFGMAYDPLRKKIVLYGGGKAQVRNELWEFDGKVWSKINAKDYPGGRLRHNLIYVDHLKMIVLHGGNEETNGWTWGWDGHNWKKIAEGGPVGDLQALGYDPIRKSIVAYGGSGSNGTLASWLWELKDGTWKKISDNGHWEWMTDKFQRVEN